jgi:hypothetical protein
VSSVAGAAAGSFFTAWWWIGLAVVAAGLIARWLAPRVGDAMDRRSRAEPPGSPLSVGPLAPAERRRARNLDEVLLLLAGGPVELLVDDVIHVVEDGQEVVLPAGTPRQPPVILRGAEATWLVSRTPELADRPRFAARWLDGSASW